MKKILIILLIVLMFSSISVYAADVTIDDSQRVSVVGVVKDTVVSIDFYGDSYSIQLGTFDFEHNRATIKIMPELGTTIVNLNVDTKKDLDGDGVDDIAFTIVSIDPNKGANQYGETGSALIRIESLTPISVEPTTVTTSVASTSTTSVTGAAVADKTGGMDTTTIAIIAGIVVGALVILFLMKDKIKRLMHRGGGAGMASSQAMPSNYKPSKLPSKSSGGMKCQKCGRDVAPGMKFCNNCGAKVMAGKKVFCPECGTEFKGGKFCQNCGHRM